jgi:putative ABC transport system substrate-binding protein
MEVRWAAGNLDRAQMFAKELVDLQPDVILSQTSTMTAFIRQATRTIPIIFVMVTDPVGQGFVASVPRPAGNLTGFMTWEESIAGKWLQLLTEVAPQVRRAVIMYNPNTLLSRPAYVAPFEEAARSLKIEQIGAKPGDLPVQAPTKYETVLNLKTAKALGLQVPDLIRLRADGVIE